MTDTPVLTKICTKCPEKGPQPLSAFGADKSVKSGFKAECKACFNKRGKAKALQQKVSVEKKVCSQCGAEKKAAEFNKWSRSPDGLQSECRDCHNGRSQPIYPRDLSIIQKTCTQCGATKLAIEFYDNPYNKTGTKSECKNCTDERNAQWFSDNPETPSHERYNYLYSQQELLPWAERTREVATAAAKFAPTNPAVRRTAITDSNADAQANSRDDAVAPARSTYVVANNHYLGKAAVNALELISILRGGKVEVPEPLRKHYPELDAIAARPAESPTLF